MAVFQIMWIILVMGGPLVLEHTRKSEYEWVNREANVIMSDWMCKCLHEEGAFGMELHMV